MSFVHITVRSLTFGQKAAAILKKHKIVSSVVRTGKKLSENGCGYSIKLKEKDAKNAVDILKRENVPYSGLWREENGSYERISL